MKKLRHGRSMKGIGTEEREVLTPVASEEIFPYGHHEGAPPVGVGVPVLDVD